MKSCKNCNYCKRLYIRKWYRYYKRGAYYCTEHDRETTLENECDKWRKKVKEFDISQSRLDEVEADIRAVFEYLPGSDPAE